MYVIFKDNLFMTQVSVNLLSGFGLIAIFLFIHFVRRYKGQKEYFSLIVVACAIGFLVYKAPLFMDVPSHNNMKYVEHTGILFESQVTSKKDFFDKNKRIIYTTTITVGNKEFKMKGNYDDFYYYKGKEVKVYYLPRSEYVDHIATDKPVNIPNN